MPDIELLEGEEIKQIENYPKYYITSFGRVWSEKTHRWLKPVINQRWNHQRQYINLGRKNRFYIHRLVAEAFIPNPNNLPEVDHIDTNGLNNNVNNLRWVTRKENMANENTLQNLKKNTGYLCEIEDMETGELFYGYEEVAKKYNLCKGTILNHTKNKVKNPRWRLTGKRIRPND